MNDTYDYSKDNVDYLILTYTLLFSMFVKSFILVFCISYIKIFLNEFIYISYIPYFATLLLSATSILIPKHRINLLYCMGYTFISYIAFEMDYVIISYLNTMIIFFGTMFISHMIKIKYSLQISFAVFALMICSTIINYIYSFEFLITYCLGIIVYQLLISNKISEIIEAENYFIKYKNIDLLQTEDVIQLFVFFCCTFLSMSRIVQ